MKKALFLCCLISVASFSVMLTGCKQEDPTPTINQIDEGLKGLPPGDDSKVTPMGGGGGGGGSQKKPTGAAAGKPGDNQAAPPGAGPPTK